MSEQIYSSLLNGALGLYSASIGIFKSKVEFTNISLELLLHAKSLDLALGLGLKSHLHALDGLAEVLPGGGELLLLLGDPPLDLLLHLGQLEGGAQHLVLLLLKSSLSLTEGSLQLHLLGLQALPDLVDLVDGAAALADLVHDVFDLVAQGLVLSANLFQLENGLVISIFDLKIVPNDSSLEALFNILQRFDTNLKQGEVLFSKYYLSTTFLILSLS